MTTNHEKYLAGEPLTPELAALKRGEYETPDPLLQALEKGLSEDPGAVLADDAGRELTDYERRALRDLRNGPGWQVLQRLLKRATLRHVQEAMRLSEEDPLGQGNEVLRLWNDVKVWKTLTAHLNRMVESEVKIGENSRGQRVEAEPSEQRA